MANQIYFFSHTKFVGDVQQMEFLYTKLYFKNFVSVQVSTCLIGALFISTHCSFRSLHRNDASVFSQSSNQREKQNYNNHVFCAACKQLEFLSQTDTKHIR